MKQGKVKGRRKELEKQNLRELSRRASKGHRGLQEVSNTESLIATTRHRRSGRVQAGGCLWEEPGLAAKAHVERRRQRAACEIRTATHQNASKRREHDAKMSCSVAEPQTVLLGSPEPINTGTWQHWQCPRLAMPAPRGDTATRQPGKTEVSGRK